MDSPSHRKLAHLLIAKSTIEALLIGALAAAFFFLAFPPYYQGWGEVTSTNVAGWVVNYHDPAQHVEVQLFIDDRFVSTTLADRSRPDLVAAGVAADEWHGYSFEIPKLTPGLHTARVYALHSSGGYSRRTLQMMGDQISFNVNAEGQASPAK